MAGLLSVRPVGLTLVPDHAPDGSMGLSDLDGILTGIVIGPAAARAPG